MSATFQQVTDWEWCTERENHVALFRCSITGSVLTSGGEAAVWHTRYHCRPLPPRPVTDAEIAAAVRSIEGRAAIEVRRGSRYYGPAEGEPASAFLVRIAKELP